MAIRAPHGVSAAGITKPSTPLTGKAGSGPLAYQVVTTVPVADYPFTDWWFGTFNAQQFSTGQAGTDT